MNLLILCSDVTLVAGDLVQEDKAKASELARGLRGLVSPAVLNAIDGDWPSIMTVATLVRFGLGVNALHADTWKSEESFPLNCPPRSNVYATSKRGVEVAFERLKERGVVLIGTERPILPFVGILVLEQRNEMMFVHPGIRLHSADDGSVTILED